MEYFSLIPGELFEEIFLYSDIHDIQSLLGLLPGYVIRSLKSKELWIRRSILEGIPRVYLRLYTIIQENQKLIKSKILELNENPEYFYMNYYQIIKYNYLSIHHHFSSQKTLIPIVKYATSKYYTFKIEYYHTEIFNIKSLLEDNSLGGLSETFDNVSFPIRGVHDHVLRFSIQENDVKYFVNHAYHFIENNINKCNENNYALRNNIGFFLRHIINSNIESITYDEYSMFVMKCNLIFD